MLIKDLYHECEIHYLFIHFQRIANNFNYFFDLKIFKA